MVYIYEQNKVRTYWKDSLQAIYFSPLSIYRLVSGFFCPPDSKDWIAQKKTSSYVLTTRRTFSHKLFPKVMKNIVSQKPLDHYRLSNDISTSQMSVKKCRVPLIVLCTSLLFGALRKIAFTKKTAAQQHMHSDLRANGTHLPLNSNVIMALPLGPFKKNEEHPGGSKFCNFW